MKPVGPIPDHVRADAAGALTVGGVPLAQLLAAAGDTPLFVHDAGRIAYRVAQFRRAMPPGISLLYAVKANPLPALLAEIAPLVDGFDIASEGELAAVLATGAAPGVVHFAGPGKRDRELAAALRLGVTVSVESAGEAERLLALADTLEVRARAMVRVNPAFALGAAGLRMGGGPSAFGIDEEAAPAVVHRLVGAGADWRGVHVYAGTQSLDADAIAAMQGATIAIARALGDAAGAAPPVVNLGGGFGVPYHAGDRPLDVAAVGAALGAAIDASGLVDAGTRFVIELGRWLVSDAGVYLTRVVDVKDSRGQIFAIVDGGMHHLLAASGNLGGVIRRNYPVALASRFGTDGSAQALVSDPPVTIAGCLCTPIDRLCDTAALPRPEVGEMVAVFQAGGYGASASPTAFLGHPAAAELVVRDGLILHHG